ncbi:YlxR family protein [Plantactinospora siamensis]|uniref:YlxR family protein n=1 Tax=Plantactinospora siamensis TaxID=555372 RepID=A0ABV6NTR7_9ACTN
MVRRTRPVRTCVGCRQRASVHELLRFTAVGDEGGYALRPDPDRRLPGRGAHLHPDPACLALAQRRRAFGRALRIGGVPDTDGLARHIEASTLTSGHPDRARVASKVGRPT